MMSIKKKRPAKAALISCRDVIFNYVSGAHGESHGSQHLPVVT